MSAVNRNLSRAKNAKRQAAQTVKPENPGLKPYSRRPASVMAVLWDGSPKSKAAVIELAMAGGCGCAFENMQSGKGNSQLTAIITKRQVIRGEAQERRSLYQTGVWLVRDCASGLLFKVSRAAFERDYEVRL